MNKTGITQRQATMWFTLYQLGSALLILPSSLAAYSKQNAWLSVLLTMLIFIVLSPLFITIAKQMGDRSFHNYLTGMMGNLIGKTVMVLFLIAFPFLTFWLVLKDLSNFVTTSIFPETPPEAVHALILIAVVLGVRAGVTVIGRSAELLFFIVILLVAIGFLSLLPVLRFDYLLPMLEGGFKPIIHGSILLLAYPYLECVLYLFLVPDFQDASKWKLSLMKSTLTSGMIFLIITVTVVATLSEGVTANLVYPSYFVIRTISYADIYQRFEIVIAILWYITIFFRLALLLHVVTRGLADTIKIKNANKLVIPLALIGFVMAKDVLPNVPSVIRSFEVWPYYVFVFSLILPAILLMLGWMRRARGGNGTPT